MLLLKVELLTLINIDSLIFLAKLCPSLPIILKLARNIKESIFIRVNNSTLNNNIGKFNLPHIWDRVLLNTPGLNLKRQVNNNNNNNNINNPFQ